MLQFGRTGAEPAALQHHIRFRRIGYDHHQQLLVNVNSCYILRHVLTFPAREARSARQDKYAPSRASIFPSREDASTLTNSNVRSGSGLLTDSTAPKRCRPHSRPHLVEIMPHLEKIFITSDVP